MHWSAEQAIAGAIVRVLVAGGFSVIAAVDSVRQRASTPAHRPVMVLLRETAMPAWPSLRFLAIVTCLVSFVGVEAAIAQTVGTVTRVEKQAQVGSTPAVNGMPVNMN